MGIGEIVELAKVVKEIGDLATTRTGRGEARQAAEAIQALRMIYFSPKSVLMLLNMIAQGHRPTDEQVAVILPPFNDAEWRVERMLWRLDYDANGELPMRHRRILDSIRYGKMDVRREVQTLLNEALTTGNEVVHEDAKKLAEAIETLNLAIEDAELALLKVGRN